ncbi:MAG: adenosylcobinamide-phosphate synthase CbiB [Desulfosudaceae bacterium]
MFDVSWYIIVAAFALDWWLGDPDFAAHPIRLMGKAIAKAEPLFRRLPGSPVRAGLFFAVTLVIGAGAGAALLIHLAGWASFLLAEVVAVVLLYFCVSARGLEKAAMIIHGYLAAGDMTSARKNLAFIVGREVERLPREGVARAAVETVAENLVDGVMAPLFFAVIGGVPLAVAYKMVNTLDSMVGYKNERYLLFGKAAARIDDAANFIPARLAVLFIPLAAALLFKRGLAALVTAVREGRHHGSPNAGYPEAAFAGALSIWLGGPNYYHGRLVDKPRIGHGMGEAAPEHICQACRLMLLTAGLAGLAAAVAAGLW